MCLQGMMIPEGADGMVMIEYTEKLDDQTLMVYRPISVNENMVLRGEDIGKGDLALRKGKRMKSRNYGGY